MVAQGCRCWQCGEKWLITESNALSCTFPPIQTQQRGCQSCKWARTQWLITTPFQFTLHNPHHVVRSARLSENRQPLWPCTHMTRHFALVLATVLATMANFSVAFAPVLFNYCEFLQTGIDYHAVETDVWLTIEESHSLRKKLLHSLVERQQTLLYL